MENAAGRIRRFVEDNFLFCDGGETLGDGDSFLERGIIDSTGVLELISFLEGTYGVRYEDEDLVPENLDSIAGITAFLARKLKHAGVER